MRSVGREGRHIILKTKREKNGNATVFSLSLNSIKYFKGKSLRVM